MWISGMQKTALFCKLVIENNQFQPSRLDCRLSCTQIPPSKRLWLILHPDPTQLTATRLESGDSKCVLGCAL